MSSVQEYPCRVLGHIFPVYFKCLQMSVYLPLIRCLPEWSKRRSDVWPFYTEGDDWRGKLSIDSFLLPTSDLEDEVQPFYAEGGDWRGGGSKNWHFLAVMWFSNTSINHMKATYVSFEKSISQKISPQKTLSTFAHLTFQLNDSLSQNLGKGVRKYPAQLFPSLFTFTMYWVISPSLP